MSSSIQFKPITWEIANFSNVCRHNNYITWMDDSAINLSRLPPSNPSYLDEDWMTIVDNIVPRGTTSFQIGIMKNIFQSQNQMQLPMGSVAIAHQNEIFFCLVSSLRGKRFYVEYSVSILNANKEKCYTRGIGFIRLLLLN